MKNQVFQSTTAQSPRVLTTPEVAQLPIGSVVYREERAFIPEETPQHQCTIFCYAVADNKKVANLTNPDFGFQYINAFTNYTETDELQIVGRWWNAKPTNEDMLCTPWENKRPNINYNDVPAANK